MKFFVLASVFTATSLFAAEFSTSPDFTESQQLTLHCIDKRTLADAPGEELMLAINSKKDAAFVLSNRVRMRGHETSEWKMEDSNASVRQLADDGLFISKRQTQKIDWSTGPCYRIIPSFSVSLKLNEFGSYVGEFDRNGIIEVNPVALCNFPRIARAQPVTLVCNLY